MDPRLQGLTSEGDLNLSPNRAKWARELSADTRGWLEQDARYFLHQSLSTPCLDVLARCEGSCIEDLDFHGNNVHHVGFANPHVIEAIERQMRTLAFSPRR